MDNHQSRDHREDVAGAAKWPLVGRDEELLAAVEALSGPGVVVAGEAGVGKTRLALEILDTARERGWVVGWATASEAARVVPFGALAHLLPTSLGQTPTWANLLRVAADGLTEHLAAADGRLVVGVDDAYLLDEHSAALLGLLAATGRARVVATVRTGDRAPDAVTALWKDTGCARLELQPQSRSEVARLVEAALGAPIDGAGLEALWRVSAGNPLFLRELVTGGREAGRLSSTGEVWRWRGPILTAGLAEVVGARLDGLAPAERGALEVVALSEPVSVGVAEDVAGTAALEAAQRRGLLEESTDGRRRFVRLAHPVYGEVLRAQMPPATSRSVCASLAAAVERCGARRGGDALRMAIWRVESDDPGEPELLVRAARDAITLLGNELAHRLAEAAVAAGSGFEARLLRTETLVGLGKSKEAEAELAVLQAEADRDDRRLMAAQARALNLATGLGELGAALEVLEEAEAQVADPSIASEVAAYRAFMLFLAGSLREAVATGEQVLHQDRVSDAGRTMAGAAAAFALLYSGRIERAVEVIDAAEGRAPDVAIGRDFGFDAIRVLTALFAGRLGQAAEQVEGLYRAAVERSAPVWVRGTWASLLGTALRVQGLVEQAIRWQEEGVALLEEADTHGNLATTLAELAHARALLGRDAGAEEALARAESRWAPHYNCGYLAEARVWLVAASGERTAAQESALGQARDLARDGLRLHAAALLHHAARLGAAEEAAPRLVELAGEVDGELVDAYTDHATALAAGDADGLLEVSCRFEGMGASLDAAEAAAQAARLWRRAGRRGSALTAAARAREQAERCGDVVTPALEGLDDPLPITAREREVSGLAARGLTNSEIAERLTVSHRTVHNHLTHVYAKLGIDGREELARILRAPAATEGTPGADQS